PDDAYGGTYRLFARVFAGWGLTHDVVPISHVPAVRDRLAARKTAVIWAETPTNPLLGIADIRGLAEVAHEAGALLVVDNTFASRMDLHCRNAMRVAQMLAEHPAVSEVLYPGLPSHPGHKTAQEQMRAFGGIVSFRLLAGEEAAVRACGRTRLFTLGESLGGV